MSEQEEPQQVEEATAYEVHITFPRAMQEKLRKSVDLAYKLGLIPKPKLAELMNLFIGLGMSTLKSQYLKRMGQG